MSSMNDAIWNAGLRGEPVISAAKDLVVLWENRKIAGTLRSERNAAIDQARTNLIEAVHEYEAVSRSTATAAGKDENPQQGKIQRSA